MLATILISLVWSFAAWAMTYHFYHDKIHDLKWKLVQMKMDRDMFEQAYKTLTDENCVPLAPNLLTKEDFMKELEA